MFSDERMQSHQAEDNTKRITRQTHLLREAFEICKWVVARLEFYTQEERVREVRAELISLIRQLEQELKED